MLQREGKSCNEFDPTHFVTEAHGSQGLCRESQNAHSKSEDAKSFT